MAKEKRRSSEEVQKLAQEAKALIAGGMAESAAAAQVGLSQSVLARVIRGYITPAKAKLRAATKLKREKRKLERGSIRADAIPPRPQGGARTPKPINMNDVQSLAARISKIDRALAKIEPLAKERRTVADRLMALLKQKRIV